jgi:serine/threonine protein kinase
MSTPQSTPTTAASATQDLDRPITPDEAVGQTIGRYKILERLGEGGCGVVYVAEQTVPVRRRVALKVIKLGMDTKAVVARFEAERQALAMMDHPNIAKVLDAGTTDTGRPYFVMELVRGIRITDYCDQSQLTTTQRLELLIKICQAIQHAHQKGIIHRDIKPSNILVTLHDGVPVPKVIDFGIAKATETRLTEATVYTQLHQFIGTPAYMSPEQAEMSGLDIDTRSDIYSLGVLLYELLTGSTPFDARELAAAGLDAMRKTIREIEPVRPSTRCAMLGGEELTTTAKRRSADGPRLIHQLRGDLDWIVMKCLEKDRSRRYETANGLAMDLRRHLSDEPVIARPPSSIYRFQKLFRRNRLAFSAAAAVVAALLLGLLLSLYSYVKKNEAYRQAQEARSQAEGLVTFMIEDLNPALTEYGRLPLLKQVTLKTVAYFDALPPELRTPATDLGRADATMALGNILEASGDRAAAAAKFQAALATYQDMARQNPDMPEASAGALFAERGLRRVAPPQSSAELDLALQEAVRRARELRQKHPDNDRVDQSWVATLWDRASVAAVLFNKPQEAIALSLELRDWLQAKMIRRPENRTYRALYAGVLNLLATSYDAAGDRDQSARLSDEALAQFDKILRDDPANLRMLQDAANAARIFSYRVAAVSAERSRDAELIARERYRTLITIDPTNAAWRHQYAWTHMMECYYFQRAGRQEEARAAFKTFSALLEPVVVDGTDREKLVSVTYELAHQAALVGDVADAHAQLAAAVARFQAYVDGLPVGSFDRIQARVRSLGRQAEIPLFLNELAEAAGKARELIAVAEEGLQQRPDDGEMLLRRADGQLILGTALLQQGSAAEAVTLLRQSVAGFRDAPPAATYYEDRDTHGALAAARLAEALARTGDFAQARTQWESAIAVREAQLTKQPDLWPVKQELTLGLVSLAKLLDPAVPQEAARRQSLLDRAAAILGDPAVQGRLDDRDKSTLAEAQSLRGATIWKSGE